jgi:uncharacterized protein (DUF302 family)
MNSKRIRVVVWALVAVWFGGMAAVPVLADGNPTLWKYKIKGDFAAVYSHMKSGLEAKQFILSGEEDLAAGLENNKHMFEGKDYNTIGFKDVRAVHFCSIMFNQEVFNIDMDWSVLCPFKVVAYTMKKDPQTVNIVMVRPSYVLSKDKNKKAKEIGKKIDERVFGAITAGVKMEIP